jgi:hypothetical protein
MEVIIVVLLIPVAIILAVVAVLMFLGASREAVALEEDYEGDAVMAREPERPWWGTPLFWLAVSAVFVLLGLFVWPQLFGGVFLFLPFIWIGGGKSSRRRARRSTQRRPASQ